jgi:hypothetical protein
VKRRVVVAVLLVGLVVAGGVTALVLRGGGSSTASVSRLDTTRLRPGACRELAGPLSVVHEQVGRLDAKADPRQAREPLTKAQKVLLAASPEADLTAPLQQLTTQIGFLRALLDGGSPTDMGVAELTRAAKAVEQVCLGATANGSH